MSREEWNQALIKAADTKDTAALRQALENNADINTKDANGFTPVIIAAFQNHFETLDILVENGAELNHMTTRGSSALSLALYHMPHSAEAQKCLDRLLEAGADPSRDSSLEIAAGKGLTAYVERFIAAGADVNKGVPLIPAATGGYTDILRILIAANADVNAKRANGETALSYAVMKGHTDCAKLLVAAGANIHVRNDENETILHRAVHGGDNFKHFDTDFFAAIDKNARNKRGMTALMEAAHRGYKETVTALLETGAKTDITGNNGQTALSLAQQTGHDDCLRVLIAHGADTSPLSDRNKEKFAKDLAAYQQAVRQTARRERQQAVRRHIRKK